LGSTIVEKILARHAGRDRVQAGEVVIAEVDYAMVTDTRAVNTIKMIDRFGDKPLQFAKKPLLFLIITHRHRIKKRPIFIRRCERSLQNEGRVSTISVMEYVIRCYLKADT